VAELVARVVHQLFRQVERGGVPHLEGRREIELAHHFAHRRDDLGLRVAAWHAPQPGGAIEHLVAVHVLVVHALGRYQQARVALEVAVIGEGHPKRRHRLWSRFVHTASPG
jgi:hypothetical protein